MKSYVESFLDKFREDGSDLSGSHPTSLLKAFYRYLVDVCFLATPEEMEKLRETIRRSDKALVRGQSMHDELRKTRTHARHQAREAQHALNFLDKPQGTWSSPNPDKKSPHTVCVDPRILKKIAEAKEALDELLKDVFN